ncbi:MAG TPA: RDD family protein, partial [Myxococcaceae bacterium]|nr:RDD family protein [Myxococcaceae bacterium]
MSRLRAPDLRVVPEDGIPESPYPRCSLLLRGMARLADVGVAWVLALAAGRAGLVVALLYLLLADGIFHGQSVGKRIFGVKAVFLPMRTDARFRDSTLRNAPLALIVLLRMMPEPLGLRA